MKVTNILIIDDNNIDRATYNRALSKYFDQPFEILEAVNGREALKLLNEKEIDCILLDYELTDTNGIDLMKMIRKHIKRYIPIIMITGEGNENIAVMALKLGAHDYLMKDSIKSQELVAAIKSAIKQKTHNPIQDSSFIIYLAGLLIFLIATIALIGLYTHNPLLFQIQANYPPTHYNTALSFFFLGLALLTTSRMPRLSTILSSIVLLISVLTLIEYLFGFKIGIDNFFMKQYVHETGPYPGRMTPSTMICFIFSSTVLLLYNNSNEFKFKLLLQVMLSSLILVIAFNAFTGYTVHLPYLYGGRNLNSMGLLTNISFIITGIGLLFLNMRSYTSEELILQNYFPWVVFFIGGIFFLLLWNALEIEEKKRINATITRDAGNTYENFNAKMTVYISNLLRMDRRLAMDKTMTQAQWYDDANQTLKDMEPFSLIALLDQNKNIKWAVNKPYINTNGEEEFIKNCIYEYKQPPKEAPLYLITTINDLEYVCITKPNSGGYLVGLINTQIFMTNMIKRLRPENYSIVFRQHNTSLAINPFYSQNLRPDLAKTFSLPIIDGSLKMQILPYELFVEDTRSTYPWVAFAIGILSTFLFAYSLYIRELSKKREQILLNETKHRLILESRFQLITSSAYDAILMLDKNDKIVFWNQSATKFFGYQLDEALNKTVRELLIPERYHESYDRRFKVFRKTGKGPMLGKPIELIVVNKEGKELSIEVSISSVKVGSNWEAIVIMRDITDRKISDAIIYHQANFDNLTDLPNRMLLALLLKNSILQADRIKSKLSLLSLDLDGFKNVNDQYGHDTGDKLLKVVGERLHNIIRATDAVARPGGDEFMIILTNLSNIDEVKNIAQKILDEIAKPFLIDNHQLKIGVTIGIADYPDDGKTLKDIMIMADKAMYAAKKSGKNKYCFYNELPPNQEL